METFSAEYATRFLEEEKRVPDAIVQVLAEAGVDTVFGIAGGYMGAVFDALFDWRSEVRTVLTREESLAGVMAEVSGRLTGKPGVLIGQGIFLLSNATLGILEAYLGSSPMVILADFTDQTPFTQHGPYQVGTGDYGGWDARQCFKGITKATMSAHDPIEAIQMTQLAVKHALTGECGPVAVLFHSNALRGTVHPSDEPRLYSTGAYLPAVPVSAAPSSIEAAAKAVATAERPVVIAGNGVRVSQAFEELRSLSELLRAPVATTAGGKGVIAETHELALGVVGTFGPPVANTVVGQSDLVVIVGSKLSPSDTATASPEVLDPQRQVLIQIDVEALNSSWTFPVHHSVIGDAGATLRNLVQELKKLDVPSKTVAEARDNWLSEARAVSSTAAGPLGHLDTVPLLPQRIIQELNEALPEAATVTCDAGENRLFMMHWYQTKRAGAFIQPSGSGGMGYAIPAALAVQLARPNERAVAVCGDGGFAMALNGLLTAHENHIPIIVVVFNNQALGWVLHAQGDRPIASEFSDFDFAAVARAMGCGGIRVQGPGEVKDAIAQALEEDRPVVIDVVTSRESTYHEVTSPLAKPLLAL